MRIYYFRNNVYMGSEIASKDTYKRLVSHLQRKGYQVETEPLINCA